VTSGGGALERERDRVTHLGGVPPPGASAALAWSGPTLTVALDRRARRGRLGR
jgi:hypothetical protein